MTTTQPGSGVVLRDGKHYPACIADDPAAMTAMDQRYGQLLADWDLPDAAEMGQLRAVFGTTAQGPAQAA